MYRQWVVELKRIIENNFEGIDTMPVDYYNKKYGTKIKDTDAVVVIYKSEAACIIGEDRFWIVNSEGEFKEYCYEDVKFVGIWSEIFLNKRKIDPLMIVLRGDIQNVDKITLKHNSAKKAIKYIINTALLLNFGGIEKKNFENYLRTIDIRESVGLNSFIVDFEDFNSDYADTLVKMWSYFQATALLYQKDVDNKTVFNKSLDKKTVKTIVPLLREAMKVNICGAYYDYYALMKIANKNFEKDKAKLKETIEVLEEARTKYKTNELISYENTDVTENEWEIILTALMKCHRALKTPIYKCYEIYFDLEKLSNFDKSDNVGVVCWNLYDIYIRGIGNVEENAELAYKYLKQSADASYSKAELKYADYLDKQGKHEQAVIYRDNAKKHKARGSWKYSLTANIDSYTHAVDEISRAGKSTGDLVSTAVDGIIIPVERAVVTIVD